jgi:hypothetical protein
MATDAPGQDGPNRASRRRTLVVGALSLAALALIAAWLYATAVIAYLLLSDECLGDARPCSPTPGDARLGIALSVVALVGAAAIGMGLARLLRRGSARRALRPLALAAVTLAIWVLLLVTGFGL